MEVSRAADAKGHRLAYAGVASTVPPVKRALESPASPATAADAVLRPVVIWAPAGPPPGSASATAGRPLSLAYYLLLLLF